LAQDRVNTLRDHFVIACDSRTISEFRISARPSQYLIHPVCLPKVIYQYQWWRSVSDELLFTTRRFVWSFVLPGNQRVTACAAIVNSPIRFRRRPVV